MNALADIPPWEREASTDEVARLRVPPHSLEAEQSLLGGLLLDNAAWERVGDVVAESDLYRHEHRRIFAAIASLVIANKPADVITVAELLRADKGGDDYGGMGYLQSLADAVPSARNARRYAEIVREKAVQRSLVAKSDEIATMAFDGTADVTETVAKAAAMFDDLLRDRGQQGPRTADALAVNRVDHYNDLATGDAPIAFGTGLIDVDEALNGGLQEGRVYVLAARPSIGKSSLALQIGLHHAKELNRGVLVLSLEMPGEEVADRALANLGEVDYGNMQRGTLSDQDWGRFSAAVEVFGKLPLWIDDQAGLTLRDIRAKAFGLRRDGLKLLVLDYLQLCSGQSTGKNVNRNTELEEITRGLKTLAKQLRISILLLSQLSRDVERRGTPEPTLADLRDSGAIEQDADAVLGLWFVRQWSDRKVMALTVLKNRQGERGKRIPLEFLGQHQLWVNSGADVNPVTKSSGKGEGGFE